MGSSGKAGCLLQTDMDLKLFQELWPEGFILLLSFFSFFFSFGTTSKCCKQFERVLKTPSDFPFNE